MSLKQKATRSALKCMAIICFDMQVVVHTHLVPPKTSVNTAYYLTALKLLIEQHIPKKWSAYWKGNWKLHFDNYHVHTADAVTQCLTRRSIKIVSHPVYSLGRAPNNFSLYSTLKKILKGRHFPTLQAVRMEVYTQLQCVSKDGISHVFEAENQWRS